MSRMFTQTLKSMKKRWPLWDKDDEVQMEESAGVLRRLR